MEPIQSTRRAAALLAGAALLAALWALLAPAGAAARSVQFDGRQIEVPKGWQVIRLAKQPRTCVRLDRRVVYLGAPAANQRCPAEAIGRRRAILVEPRAAGAARAEPPRAPRRASASAAVFTGLGFDACTAPSRGAMSSWLRSSPYRAIGVYIGGLNRACSQPNLTASWVDAQTEAGWHLIPTYVGLQAPKSACTSCALLSSNLTTARKQGAAAAIDAVADASAVAMGPGSPIYYDMEAYTQTASSTAATLAFLEAWTIKIHQLGYLSGVYSSSASGIEDLADQIGTGYVLPDQLWTANWNGQKNTDDPNIPAYAWTEHQRIHQYRGGHNETWAGVTIAIDNNYVDGATVGSASLGSEDDPIGWLDLSGTPRPGHLRVRGWAFDPNDPAVTLPIRIQIGGRAGSPDAEVHELGPVANRKRADVAAEFPEAGSFHGFDQRLAVTKSGRQRVCAYAVGVAPGGDGLLGCKATRIPPAVVLKHARKRGRWIKVWVKCTWPEGTECPGQLALRTRFKVRQRRAGRVRTRVLTRSLGRRKFRLDGGRGHVFKVRIGSNGRRLLRLRGPLRTQLIAAIPGGGRRYEVLKLDD